MTANAIMELGIFNLSADNKGKKASPATTTPKPPEIDEEDELDDSSSLFWQPGKRGYYSPRPGKGTPERHSAFRNVGRCVFVAGDGRWEGDSSDSTWCVFGTGMSWVPYFGSQARS